MISLKVAEENQKEITTEDISSFLPQIKKVSFHLNLKSRDVCSSREFEGFKNPEE